LSKVIGNKITLAWDDTVGGLKARASASEVDGRSWNHRSTRRDENRMASRESLYHLATGIRGVPDGFEPITDGPGLSGLREKPAIYGPMRISS